MRNSSQIIKEELEAVFKEAVQLYERSGKKTSGNWPKGGRVEVKGNKGTLYSYAYLAGRGPTKKAGSGPTLKDRILEWLSQKGIRPIEKKMKLSSLAYVIARKIHREGTDKSRHIQVFEEVLTPERIQKIIDRVAEFNVGLFVKDTEAIFEKLSKNV